MVEDDIPAVRSVDGVVNVGHVAVHRRKHEVEGLAVGVDPSWADVDALVEALTLLADHAEQGRLRLSGDRGLQIVFCPAD